MRLRSIIIIAALSLGALAGTPSASAQADDGPTTTTTVLAGAVSIGDGFAFTGAKVYSPGEAAPGTWDAYQSAVFVQSWLPNSFFGQAPTLQDPPTDVSVNRIDITGTWANKPGMISVFYATDGTTTWLSLPQDQEVRTIPGTPPEPSGWEVVDDRVRRAFDGSEKLEQTTGVRLGTTTTTVPGSPAAEEATSAPDSGSDTPWAWIGIGIGLVVLAAGGLALRRLRRSPVDPPPD